MENIEDKIIEACKINKTMLQACKDVGIPFSIFKRKAEKLGVYKPNQGAKGTFKPIKKLKDIFEGRTNMKSTGLKVRLIREGYKEEKCEECGLVDWNNKPITLELDHKNGDTSDNRLKNLRILCPNCHSQTETFRRKKSSLM